MMTVNRLIFSLVLLTLLAGCGSTPRSDYYVLSSDAAGKIGNEGPSLGLGPITIPEYLKRREMVRDRQSHKLNFAEFDRWAEPLDSGILRVTVLNLSKLLNTQQIQPFPFRRSSLPDYAISIAVIELGTHGTTALLVTEWRVSNPVTGESLSQNIHKFEVSVADTNPETVATAYSELLRQLAVAIADAVKQQIT